MIKYLNDSLQRTNGRELNSFAHYHKSQLVLLAKFAFASKHLHDLISSSKSQNYKSVFSEHSYRFIQSSRCCSIFFGPLNNKKTFKFKTFYQPKKWTKEFLRLCTQSRLGQIEHFLNACTPRTGP